MVVIGFVIEKCARKYTSESLEIWLSEV